MINDLKYLVHYALNINYHIIMNKNMYKNYGNNDEYKFAYILINTWLYCEPNISNILYKII